MDLDAFVRDGYVAVRGPVDAVTVAACRERIWAAMERREIRQDDPGTWPPLVEGLTDLAAEPLVAAYLAPALTAAYDELIGPGLWRRPVRPADFGETVVVRFPAEDERANARTWPSRSFWRPTARRAPTGREPRLARSGWRRIRDSNS